MPSEVNHIYGNRKDLLQHKNQFQQLAPDVVLDMICMCAQEAKGMASLWQTSSPADLLSTFRGIAKRLVVVSSCDVYYAYGIMNRSEDDAPESTVLTEDRLV